MVTPYQDKRIVLGITGSIAAYKAADLASKMAQAGALVDVILTGSAAQFVTPLTFQSVTGRMAFTDSDLWGSQGHIQHIGLARKAQLLVIAPITANTIAKLTHGIADNLLTVTTLAASCPVVIAPAMDGGMFNNPATQENLKILDERDVTIIGPAEGHLASGMTGLGRMVEPQTLLGHIRHALSRGGPLRKKKIVVTAGGTFEPIDPVRGITNRSSGKQGFALAQAALDRGAEVTLISGPTQLTAPVGAEFITITSAEEMETAVLKSLADTTALIMAAAVADYRPAKPSAQKVKKSSGIPEISLVGTTDILTAVAAEKSKKGYPTVTVGFAAESHDLINNARQKLEEKNLDLIVANDISAEDSGIAVDDNRVTIIDAGGGQEDLPLMDKFDVAQHVLERVLGLLGLSVND
ncbi:MAG: bifunctional phosphopantothenoylcysteine decarboxylase/phosphopantothenate--cysteine ligase CoaBC [Chloroflexota bacterium]|nr:MAG: bifunctional phosphopantothenoylcysteine decarboxylase/phosphopantothenate--cysteine ligase CoaBC [Chloroflexota bacterium]